MVTRAQQQERRISDTYHALRTAIAWQLKAHYEAPMELPPQLVALVAAMDQPKAPCK
jgi:hypothetical protein